MQPILEAEPSDSDVVLFVDDEPEIRKVFEQLLTRARIPVQGAPNGEEALLALTKTPGRFAVIVADYTMPPGMDGVTFLREAATIAPWATRILASGHLDLPNVMRAVNSGAVFQIIAKPWQVEQLVPQIRRAQERSNLVRHNAQLMAELKRKNQDLEELNQSLDRKVMTRTTELLEALVGALDLRDAESQFHSRRVAAYARRLGEAINLSPEKLRSLEQGALLHDLGKLAVGDHIFKKGGALNEDEWGMIKKHPEHGYRLLNGVEFLRDAAEIVYTHREQWDGSGFPRGLKGEDIPLGARLLSAAEMLDALTTATTYRPAQGWAYAREELQRVSGSHLDPEVVRAFLEVPEDDWRAIRARLSSPDEAPADPATF